jgi:acyl-CoA synthetase (AMP-forming)/AMP-acid ligase II
MGDKPAVICEGRVLSWNQLHQQLNQVANGLLADGLETGDRVAVLMDNSPDMLLALFGIILAGGVSVPLNTLVADEGLANMVENSAAIAVFASEAHASRLDRFRDRLDGVNQWYGAGFSAPGWTRFEDWRHAQPAGNPGVALEDSDECNIIYSSGTTGMPKGIVHTHRRRIDWFYDLAIALRYDRASVSLCSIGLFSNISWASLGCTLLTGGTIVIMPDFDAGNWLETAERHRITHSAMVPVQFERILAAPDFSETRLDGIKSLMCCGSPLSADLKARIMENLSPRLVELYGLTEGVITTLDPEDAKDRLDSVGKPLMGTDLLILDDDDRPCPPGTPGEIVGRGRHLMAGYHDRPEANAAATWTDEAGRRWLRTGDIGRLDEAGFLYLVDRKKDMIISGGMNLYPADIEAAVISHPGIEEVAVIAIDSERWGESPFAVLVGARDETLDTEALVTWTNERVGKHQRLAGAVQVDELPRNANGKILKRALRDQYRGWLSRSQEPTSP